MIIKNHLILLLISKTLDCLAGSKIFTKLDLTYAYYRLCICRGDKWKMAFRTRYGHFKYLVLPFRLTNRLVTFQGYINRVLSGLVDVFCVVYFDNILIFFKNLEEY